MALSLALLLGAIGPLLGQDRNVAMNIVYPTGAFTPAGGPVINIKNINYASAECGLEPLPGRIPQDIMYLS